MPPGSPVATVRAAASATTIAGRSWFPASPPASTECVAPDLRREACQEAMRLESARRLSDEAGTAALANLEATGPWVVRARLRTSRLRLGRRIIAILRIDDEDGTGRLAGWTVVGLTVDLSGSESIARGQLKKWLSRLETDLRAPAEAARRADSSASDRIEGFLPARVAREKRMAKSTDTAVPAPFQPGLFDRRADYARFIEKRLTSQAAVEISNRIRTLDRSRSASGRPARLLLVLVP
jgi:hypothetical protein